jgi:glycosyltransferase involved in cell wall biosynthesis
VNRVLDRYGLQDIVHLHDRIPHECVQEKIQHADLLFLTLPDRLDGSPGGRVSLKTYEYLMTDRPILAAVPPGENRTFLASKRGTFVADPKDVGIMAQHISLLAHKQFSGEQLSVDRSHLKVALSSERRADHLNEILTEVVSRVSGGTPSPFQVSAMSQS